MTNEEKMEHVRRIVGVLDGLGIVERLDVIAFVYKSLAYILVEHGGPNGRESQKELLAAICEHLEGTREAICGVCATYIFGGESDVERTKEPRDNH